MVDYQLRLICKCFRSIIFQTLLLSNIDYGLLNINIFKLTVMFPAMSARVRWKADLRKVGPRKSINYNEIIKSQLNLIFLID